MGMTRQRTLGSGTTQYTKPANRIPDRTMSHGDHLRFASGLPRQRKRAVTAPSTIHTPKKTMNRSCPVTTCVIPGSRAEPQLSDIPADGSVLLFVGACSWWGF